MPTVVCRYFTYPRTQKLRGRTISKRRIQKKHQPWWTTYIISAISLQNYGQVKIPTKRRAIITHSTLNPPGRLSNAAAWATKYTAHLPPSPKSNGSILLLHLLPYEADWLLPQPLLPLRLRGTMIDVGRNAKLHHLQHCSHPWPCCWPMWKLNLLVQKNINMSRNNNHCMPPILNHSWKGW